MGLNFEGKLRKKGIFIPLLTLFLFVLVVSLFFATFDGVVNAGAAGPGGNWRAYESENFVLFSPRIYEGRGRKLLYYLEEYADDIEELIGEEIEDKIHLTLEDTGLMPNGFADPINARMGIFAGSPGTRSALAGHESWLRMVGVHELTHILHMTSTSGYSELATDIFGNALAPNLHSPLWLIEGIAVYAESQSSPYEGRLNSGYYDGVLAWRAGEGGIPDLPEITYNHFHFPAGHRYLYGSTFMRFLAEEYGEEKFAEFFAEYGSYWLRAVPANLFPALGPDRAAEEIYGSSIEELYGEWRSHEEKISGDWSLDGEILLSSPDSELQNLQVHDGNLYYQKSQRYPSAPFSYHTINRIMRYDPAAGAKEEILQTAAGISGTLQISSDKIYFLQEQVEGGYDNIARSGAGISTELIEYDLVTGEKRSLVSDEIRDFLVLDEGESARDEGDNVIYAPDSKNGHGSHLFKLDGRGEKKKQGTTSRLIAELHYCEQGERMLAGARGRQGSWGIFELELSGLKPESAVQRKSEHELIPIADSGWPEMHLSPSSRGDKFIFTSTYDGYRGIYGYDIEDRERVKLTEGGYAEEGVILDGDLYFLTFADGGMALARKSLTPAEMELEADESRGERETRFKDNEGQLQAEIEDLEVEEKSFWPQNLSGIWPPSLRLPPFLVGGQDAAGINTYWFNLNRYGGVDFTLESQVLQPLNIRFRSRGDEGGRKNMLTGSYPLFRSGPDGLTDISIEAGTDFAGLFLGGSMRWRYPQHLFKLGLQADLLSGDHKGELDYSYLRDEGRISLGGYYSSGFELPGHSRLPEIPGTGEDGYLLSAEYVHRLFSFNRGRWNPSVFVGGVYGGIFADYISQSGSGEKQLSGGVKIELETGLANALQPVPRVGITRTRDSWQPFAGVEITF